MKEKDKEEFLPSNSSRDQIKYASLPSNEHKIFANLDDKQRLSEYDSGLIIQSQHQSNGKINSREDDYNGLVT